MAGKEQFTKNSDTYNIAKLPSHSPHILIELPQKESTLPKKDIEKNESTKSEIAKTTASVALIIVLLLSATEGSRRLSEKNEPDAVLDNTITFTHNSDLTIYNKINDRSPFWQEQIPPEKIRSINGEGVEIGDIISISDPLIERDEFLAQDKGELSDAWIAIEMATSNETLSPAYIKIAPEFTLDSIGPNFYLDPKDAEELGYDTGVVEVLSPITRD